MSCPGCYKENVEGYCATCRRKLFGGKNVPSVLSFEAPKGENLPQYQEQTKRLSISGVQLKYSVRLEGKALVLTDRGGQYILKPIPPTTLITLQNQVPENEHLTMQIASQVFKLPVADNALIYFRDGGPAYITRRFDIGPDGSKQLQEDFAQVMGRSKATHGSNFKYEGSYEELGQLIRRYVAAYPVALEAYFRLVLFNYLFSNGDAHLKNFSLTRTGFGDYALTPAYDLMCTVLHTPHESDTALDLYANDIKDELYQVNGYYSRPHFSRLAERLGMNRQRVERIMENLLGHPEEVKEMVAKSFLSAEGKEKYLHYYYDKRKRFGVNE